MITLSKSGNSITFTFENNGHYLANGTIDVPVNSLILVTDDSEMATFKKLDGDPFISCLYSDLGMTKAELISWYEENMVGSTGGGGVTSGEVESMISSATTDFFDGVEYDSEDKAIYFYNGEDLKATIDASDFVIDGMVDNVEIQTISGASYLVIEFNTAAGKEDIQIPVTSFFDASQYYTKSEVDAALSGKADTSAMTAAISAATNDMATQTWVGQQGYITGVDLSDYATQEYVSGAVSGKADTSAVTAVSNRLDEVDEVAARALVDLDERKADTSAMTVSLSGKQDTLIAGSGITISGNVISSEGGGATYSAGTNISIDTGNTISCTLPIAYTGEGLYKHLEVYYNNNNWKYGVNQGFVIGSSNNISGNTAFIVGNQNYARSNIESIFGFGNDASGIRAFISGYYNKTNNGAEAAFGEYNISNTGSTDADKTAFSVGNGTADNARHNALEIRKNGDIYCNNGTADIKLQDYLQIKVMAISQADYDALVQGGTVDANTLYVISNVVS